ncbi:hypothetical protein pipiens_003658 [Culex pipiens pipiens]|uniref:Uncharacterized protein n=1 Tax=Culex pipiens pipiens TaxID=38569 RepID=A0ABD1CUB9_CULPP
MLRGSIPETKGGPEIFHATQCSRAIRSSTIEKQKKFQLTLVEAGRQQPWLEPIEIHSKAEEEYAVMYSAVLIDLCEGCEALDLEKQTIRKIRSEMLIASMTKVNLLSKLKDRVDIDPALPAK